MKKIVSLLAALAALVACTNSGDIPFTEVQRYFFSGGDKSGGEFVYYSDDAFGAAFRPAAVMGKDGMPTEVDFSKEFVIAAVLPVTDIYTEVSAQSLETDGKELVFTYIEKSGEKQGWSMQPALIIKASKEYAKLPVRFNKIQEQIVSENPADYKSHNIENMQRVRDFLHDAGVYFIATVDGDKPQVRPFGTAEIIEGKLYIQTGHVKNVAKQIAANPNVAICAYNAGKGEWIRISATLVEDHRVEVKKAMLDANPGLRRMYDENDDNTAVYFMKDAKATISSFVHDPVEVDF